MPKEIIVDPKLESLIDPMGGAPKVDPETVEALDDAFSKLAKEKGHEDPIPGLITPKEKEPTPEEKAAAEKKIADDKAAAEKKAAEATPEEQAAAQKKADEDKAAADKKVVADKAAADLYSDVQLPQNARGASAQAFATIKARAAADLAERDKKLAEMTAELTRLQEASKGVVPQKDVEQLKQEAENLRKWKAALDVEADPALHAKFDEKLSTVSGFIYAKLKGTGKITDEHIEAIKKIGGPAAVDWTPIFERIGDPQLQRLLQSKLDEIETVQFERQEAVQSAKKNISDYLAKRGEEFKAGANNHNDRTNAILTDMATKIPWLTPPTLKPDATEADKKAAADEKAFIDETNKTLAEAASDDSPEMRALLIMSVAQVLKMKRDNANAAGLSKADKEKITALEKDLAAAKAEVEKFKTGSVSRLRSSSAPVDSKLPASTDQFATAADALESFKSSRAA